MTCSLNLALLVGDPKISINSCWFDRVLFSLLLHVFCIVSLHGEKGAHILTGQQGRYICKERSGALAHVSIMSLQLKPYPKRLSNITAVSPWTQPLITCVRMDVQKTDEILMALQPCMQLRVNK